MTKAHMLVVEDELLVAEDIKNRLNRLGYIVSAMVSSGEEAIAKAEKIHPDLVMMDIRLKGDIDGIQAAEEIRKRFRIPVVYLTAHADEDILERAKLTEPYGYILKPFESRDLAGTIEMALYKHKMEKAVEESEALYRNLYEIAHVGSWRITVKDGAFLRANMTAANMLGYADVDYLSNECTLYEFFVPECATEFIEQLEKYGEISGLEMQLILKDGTAKDISVSASLYPAKDYIEGMMVDITEHKRADEALRESEDKYRALVENTNDLVYAVDAHGVITYVSPQIIRYKYASEEIVSKFLIDFMAPEDKDRVAQELASTMETGEEFTSQFRIVDAEGNRHWVEDFGKTINDESGNIIGLTGVLRDITKRKWAEESLAESEENYRLIAETATEGIYQVDDEGRFIFVNEAYAKILGYEREELLGKHYTIIIPEAMIPDAEKIVGSVMAGTPAKGDFTLKHKLGHSVPTYFSMGPLKKRGKVGFSGIIDDITERKRNEEELQIYREQLEALVEERTEDLRKSNENLQHEVAERKLIAKTLREKEYIIQSASSAIATSDLEGNMSYGNPAFIKTWGFDDVNEFLGKPFWEFWMVEDRVDEIMQALRGEGMWFGEILARRKDGTLFDVQVSAAAVLDSAGKFVGLMSTSTDITERKQMEVIKENTLNAMQERMKELNCMYSIGNSIRTRTALEEVFHDTVSFIPNGWHYSEITRGRIVFDGEEYVTQPFEKTPWKQASDIVIDGLKRGSVEAYYLEESPELDEGPFVKEERNLIEGIARTLAEVIELKQAEEALRYSEEKYRSLVESAPNIIMTVDPDHRITFINRTYPDIDVRDVLGKTVYEFSEPDDHEVMKAAFDHVLRTGKPTGYEVRGTGPGGTILHYAVSMGPIKRNSEVVALNMVVTDITDLKRAEAAIRESREEYRLLADNTSDFVTLTDLKGTITYASPSHRKLGLDPEDYVGSSGAIQMLPDDLQRVSKELTQYYDMEYITELIRTGKEAPEKRVDYRVYDAWGNVHHLESNTALILDPDGEKHHIMLISRDITERKQAEEEAKESKERAWRQQQAIVRIATNDAVVAGDSDQAMRAVTEIASEALEVERVGVWLLEEEGKSLHCVDLYESGPGQHSEGVILNTQDYPDYFEALRTGRAIDAGDARTDPRTREFTEGYLDPLGITSMLDAAIRVSGELVGIVSHEHTGEQREWKTDEIAFAGQIADQVAQALTNAVRKRSEERQKLMTQILELLNLSGAKTDIIRDILHLIKAFTGIEAVGLRLNDGEDYPYYVTNGFSSFFVEAENNLCGRDSTGQLIRDADGTVVLGCMCGNIICGRTDPSQTFFTEGGSFWTNNTMELLSSTTEDDRQTRTRNRCNAEGYESVALVPLRSEGKIIGLLQLNDTRCGMFTAEKIRFFEGLGASIGIALARKQAEEQIEAQLKEKELLMQEIHHRVKNNLQTVVSLLSLQSHRVQDEQVREMFENSQSRVRTMALVHEQLYQSQDMANVNCAEFLRRIVTHLLSSHAVDPSIITLKMEAKDVVLETKKAISCGLLVNELVTNSLKYAFPSGNRGEIRIVLDCMEDMVMLIVSDDGIGLPEDMDFRDSPSLGLRLVNILASQLDGTIEVDRTKGTEFRITFVC